MCARGLRASTLGVVPAHDAHHPAVVRAPPAPPAPPETVRLDVPDVTADLRLSRRFHAAAALLVGAISAYNVAYLVRAYAA